MLKVPEIHIHKSSVCWSTNILKSVLFSVMNGAQKNLVSNLLFLFQEDSEDEAGGPSVTSQPTSMPMPMPMPAPGDATTSANESTSLNTGDKTVYTPGTANLAFYSIQEEFVAC